MSATFGRKDFYYLKKPAGIVRRGEGVVNTLKTRTLFMNGSKVLFDIDLFFTRGFILMLIFYRSNLLFSVNVFFVMLKMRCGLTKVYRRGYSINSVVDQ